MTDLTCQLQPQRPNDLNLNLQLVGYQWALSDARAQLEYERGIKALLHNALEQRDATIARMQTALDALGQPFAAMDDPKPAPATPTPTPAPSTWYGKPQQQPIGLPTR